MYSKLGVILGNYLTFHNYSYDKNLDNFIRKVINSAVYIVEDRFTVLVSLDNCLYDIWIANRWYGYLNRVEKYNESENVTINSQEIAGCLRSKAISYGRRPSKRTCIDFTEWLFKQERKYFRFLPSAAGAYSVYGKEWEKHLHLLDEITPSSVIPPYRDFYK